jgi:hypothetical protein
MIVSGQVNSPLDDDPSKVTINVEGDGFVEMTAGDDVSAWFTDMPAGLSAVILDAVTEGATSATIAFQGIPTEPSDSYSYNYDYDYIEITIPSAALQSNEDLDVQVRYDVLWRIWRVTASPSKKPTVKGTVGSIIEYEGVPSFIPLMITIEGDFIGNTSESTSWLKNLPLGLSLGGEGLPASFVAGNVIFYNITGTPTTATTENVRIVIPKEALSSKRDLVIDTDEIQFVISEP